jgi:transglutaminase-like putative cysteine protease
VRYQIERVCRIHFAAPAREHHVQIRLAPWDDESQSLLKIQLSVVPEAGVAACRDGFGNLSHHFAVLGAHRELAFTMVAEVETRLENPFDFAPVPTMRERAWISDSLHQAPRLWDFVLHQSPLTPALPERIGGHKVPSVRNDRPLLEQVQEVSAWIQSITPFDPELETPVAALPALFDTGRGCAADLAHLLIALMRQWSVPARFVSGYLDATYFDADDEDPPGTEPREQRLHHWAEVLIPGGGWRGVDPAMGLLADATYVRVAVGRDAGDVQPIRQTCRSDGVAPEVEETLAVTPVEPRPE